MESTAVGTGRRRTIVIAAVVGLVVVLVAAFLLTRDGDGTEVSTDDTTPTSTTTPSSTTTTVPPAGDTSTAVWPYASSSTRYRTPVEAARGFAVDFAGFTDPVVGSFMAGDARSGEVEVRAKARGAATTVFVRQLSSDDSWWVLGSATKNIEVDEPEVGDAIASPVAVKGRASAFEGTVQVEIRQDGSTTPIGQGFVTGSGDATLGPFAETLTFSTPSAGYGAMYFYTDSAEDGRVWEAAVYRVRFAPAPTVRTACQLPAPASPASGEMAVTVYFTCEKDGIPSPPVPVRRAVPTSPGVLRAAVDALLEGPTAAERSAGLISWFSKDTAGMVRSVKIDSGRAVVDFEDLRPVIPNASTSAGSEQLLSQLDATVFQFASVQRAQYRIKGSCDDFFEWLQFACEDRTR